MRSLAFNTLKFGFGLLLLFLIGSSQTVSAQKAYIPDTALRTVFRRIAPGSMVGDSLITNHPNVLNATVTSFTHPNPNVRILNYTGIKYFKNVITLGIGTSYSNPPISVIIPHFPDSLVTLIISNYYGGYRSSASLPSTINSLPIFPSKLEKITIYNAAFGAVKSSNLPPFPPNLINIDFNGVDVVNFPSLPSKLRELYLSNSNISSLQLFSDSLKILNIINCPLTSLPTLPPRIDNLIINGTLITNILNFPSLLKKIDVGTNKLTSLPSLPTTLVDLRCGTNQLTSLPPLPNTLTLLNCYTNKLDSLTLPPNISNVVASFNKITKFPTIPASLRGINLSNNLITEMPLNTKNITSLILDNNFIRCLPPLFSASLIKLDIANNPVNCFPLFPTFTVNIPVQVCAIGNTWDCVVYPNISGKVFYDLDSNGVQGVGEFIKPNSKLLVNNMGYLHFTNSSGKYSVAVDTNTTGNIVSIINIPNTTVTPSLYNFATTNLFSQTITNKDFALIPRPIRDLTIDISVDRPFARPVLPINYVLSYQNLAALPSGDSVTFTFDSKLNFVSSTPPPSSQIGNTLKWLISPLLPGNIQTINISFRVDTFVPIPSFLIAEADIYPKQGDFDPSNNSDAVETLIRNSYDPNIKVSNPPNLTIAQAQDKIPLTYTIHFQNLGTASAIDVRILDTLSAKFDVNTFEMIASSHPDFELSLINRVAKWVFKNINLADSATNEPASHGWVKFKIQPLTAPLVGESLINRAGIYFDYNKVVLTADAVCKVLNPNATELGSATASSIEVYPNPSNGTFNVSADLGSSTPVSIEVLSLTGQSAYKASYLATQGVFRTQLNLNDLAAGIYTLMLTTESGRAFSKLVVTK